MIDYDIIGNEAPMHIRRNDNCIQWLLQTIFIKITEIT